MKPTVFPTIISPTCTGLVADTSGLFIEAECIGTPPTTAGVFQLGCRIVQVDATAGNVSTFTNTGTTALPVFTRGAAANSSATGTNNFQVAHAIYSFATDGGAVSTITPVKTANIPANAILVGGTINPTTACTSGGSATISIGTSAGSSATSILTATAVASFTTDALINAVPVFATPVKLSATGNVTVTIGTAALTAGIIEVFVYYTVAANA